VDLIDGDELLAAEAELVLGVDQQQPSAAGDLLTLGEEGQGGLLGAGEVAGGDEAPVEELGLGDRLIVLAQGRLGRRGEDGRREGLVLLEALGEPEAVGIVACLVIAPQAAGEVAAHDELHRKRTGHVGDDDAGVGHVDDVVLDDVGRLLEPEVGELVEQVALERQRGEHVIEGREAIAGDEHQPLAGPVGVAHLALVLLAQGREVGVRERVGELGPQGSVGARIHGGCLAARSPSSTAHGMLLPMVAARVLEVPPLVSGEADQRVALSDVSWWQYEALLAIRGDRPGPRVTYLNGVLELMSPSRSHEALKKLIARLLEAYAEIAGLELEGYGSMTMRSAQRARGIEPDECYAIGGAKESPDLAIEVIWTSGGLDKLEVYKGLRVREVWLWQDQVLSVHVLRGDEYATAERSAVLPDLDLRLLASFLDVETQTRALREYRAALRATLKS